MNLYDFLRIQLRWIPRKSPKFQDCGLTFLSSQTLKLYPLNHLSKWYDKGLTFSRITSLHLSTRFISKSGKIEWIISRIKAGKINFVKCQISLWKSETTNQLSVSLHFKFVLIISHHKMLSKIPNLRYFEIVDWRGMNRPAFIAIFHYIDNFGFFQGESVKFQEGKVLS